MSTFATVSILMLAETAVLGVPAALAAIWAQRLSRGPAPHPRRPAHERALPQERPLPQEPGKANLPCHAG